MFALVSRAITLIFSIIADRLLPDHQPVGVEALVAEFPTEWVKSLLAPFMRWDAVHFVKLALEGYKSEHQLAFLPPYPLLLRWVGQRLASSLGVTSTVMFAGILVNIISFVGATFVLRILLQRIRPYRKEEAIFKAAMLAWCFNPAGIFFSTVYSESLFALLSWSAFTTFHSERTVLSMLLFFAASLLRSNGALNVVVVGAAWVGSRVREWGQRKSLGHVMRDTGRTALLCASILLPGVLYNLVHTRLLCGPPLEFGTDSVVGLLAEFLYTQWKDKLGLGEAVQGDADTVKFCKHAWTRRWYAPNYVYSYIQAKYWKVGLFRYWRWRQIPNFLLAAPIVCIAVYTMWHFDAIFQRPVHGKKEEEHQVGSRGDDQASASKRNGAKRHSAVVHWRHRLANPAFPYAAHLGIVLLVGVLFANVQITTRLICASSPVIYLGMAHIAQHPGRGRNWIVAYLVLYNILGVVLHSNHYPWT